MLLMKENGFDSGIKVFATLAVLIFIILYSISASGLLNKVAWINTMLYMYATLFVDDFKRQSLKLLKRIWLIISLGLMLFWVLTETRA